MMQYFCKTKKLPGQTDVCNFALRIPTERGANSIINESKKVQRL